MTRTTSATSRRVVDRGTPVTIALRVASSTASFARHRRFRRRSSGLTLLELLVALGILLVLMGIAVPTVASALDRRRLASVAEEVLGALLMARAHAQADGATVEILLVRGDGERDPVRMIAREIDLHAPPFEDEAGPPPLMRGWADVAILWPLNLRLVDADEHLDELERDGLDDSLDIPSRDSSGRRARGSSRGGAWTTNRAVIDRERVTLFAADGSALVGSRLRLEDGDGRTLDIVVNPFTGLPRLEDDR